MIKIAVWQVSTPLSSVLSAIRHIGLMSWKKALKYKSFEDGDGAVEASLDGLSERA